MSPVRRNRPSASVASIKRTAIEANGVKMRFILGILCRNRERYNWVGRNEGMGMNHGDTESTKKS